MGKEQVALKTSVLVLMMRLETKSELVSVTERAHPGARSCRNSRTAQNPGVFSTARLCGRNRSACESESRIF